MGRGVMRGRRRRVVAWLLWLATTTPGVAAAADFVGGSVKESANAVLTLMGFIAVPDMTTSALSYESTRAGSNALLMTQFAGGFNVSADSPLYLEGGIGFSRYDPQFVASDGDRERSIPIKWNSVAGTAGIGWDIPLTDKLDLRPIGNFTLGYVESDLSLLGRFVENALGEDLEFLNNGRLKAYGVGGSLMLDYEDYLPEREIDIELRATHISLRSFDTAVAAVSGHADATTLALWSRRRVPSGLSLLERPLRYVFEFSHSSFLGDQRGALGFDYLNQVGAGLEIDTSAVTSLVTRGRMVARYVFGDGVRGYSIGLAVTF